MKSRYIYIIIAVNIIITIFIIRGFISWKKGLEKEAALNEIPVNKKSVPEERIGWGISGRIVDRNGVIINRVKITLSLPFTVKYGYQKEEEHFCFSGEFAWRLVEKNKCFLSFYKEGYKPLKNVEFMLKEFRYTGNINSRYIKERVPVKTVVMEKIKK